MLGPVHAFLGHPRFDTPCACGHERRFHANGYAQCDGGCGCREYDGEIEALPPSWSEQMAMSEDDAYANWEPREGYEYGEIMLWMGMAAE